MKLKSITMIMAGWLTTLTGWSAEPLPYYNPGEDITTITWVSDNGYSNAWSVQMYGTGSQANPAFAYVPGYKPSSLYNVGSTVFTKELDLQTGKVYKLTFVYGSWYTAPTMRNYVKFNVALYREPKYEYKDDSNLFTEIFVKTQGDAFTGTARPSYTCYFKGDASRRYVGFGNRGGGNVTRVGLDDIRIVEVDGQTPDVVTSLTRSVAGRSVTLKFNLPTKTVVGDALTGIQTVKIVRDGIVVKEYSNQTPGASLTYTDEVTSAADYTYTVYCSNNGSNSESVSTTVTVGLEANLTAPSRAQEYGPDETKVNGAFGYNYKAHAIYVPGEGIKVKYAYPLTSYFTSQIPEGQDITTGTITRLNDGKLIVENCDAGEYLDTSIDETVRKTWQYKVDLTRYTNKTTANSSIVSLNNPLPFHPGISSTGLNEFTLIDADGDNTSWAYMNNTANAHYHDGISVSYTASHNASGKSNGDDWLITPGLLVENGKTYRVDATVFCNEIIEMPTQMMISAGKSNTIEAMSDVVIPATKFKHLTPKKYSAYYNPSFSGNAFFGVRAFDNSGGLALADFQIYEVSSELPEAVDIINVKYKETAGNATISFTAPTKTIGGASLSALEKIELYRNNELMETFNNPKPGATLSKDITFKTGTQDVYMVIPYTAAGAGLSTSVDVMVLEPPYENHFDTAADLTGFTIVDPQEMGYTWGFQSGSARSYPDRESGQDDYLITPPIHFEKGYFYKIDFKTWLGLPSGDAIEYYNNKLEVLLGDAPTVESMTTTVLEPFYVRAGYNTDKDTAKEWFTVPETGEYYLAWHSIAEPYLGQEIYLDDVNISAKIPGTYPGPVTDLVITPDQEGGLSSKIEFNIPKNDLLGNPLTSKVYTTILYRDGAEVNVWVNQEPGTAITLEDKNLTEGVHLYTVTCFGYDSDTQKLTPTRDVDKKVYIGLNAPGWVSFIKAEENPEKYGEVTITWGAPASDKDGYPLNTKDIYYTVGQVIYNPLTGNSSYEAYVSDKLFDELTFTVDTKVKGQQFMKFYVDAATHPHDSSVHPGVTCAGGPMEYYENITPFMAVGTPYELPFVESFPNSNSSHGMMGQELFGIAGWGFNRYNPQTGVMPVDGDNGLAMMEAAVAYGSSARLHTGRIELKAEQPMLSMYVYNMSDGQHRDTNDLTVSVREGMNEFVPVATKSIDDWTDGQPGWHKITVDLSEYAGKTVYIGFEGEAHRFYAYPGEEELISFIHIDKVLVSEAPAVDAALIKVGNTPVYVGTEHTVSVTVKNNAGKPLNDAVVTLKMDGEECGTKIVPTVEPGELAIVNFQQILGRDNIGKHVYSAEITAAGDIDLLDNSAVGEEFTVIGNNFPKVENLAGAIAQEGIVLNWEEPVLLGKAEEETDDFEGYDSWLDMYTGIGNYLLVDADGLGVGGFEQGSIPIEMGSKQSFTLWDFSYEDEDGYKFFGDDARYKAHSGDKCLVSMFGSKTEFTDDRLISPLLSGDSQKISFYAKSLAHAYPETFQVYYSTNGTSFEDFQDNYFPMETANGDWKEYMYTLPEGANYFMIRHYSVGGYFFFVDDLTYTPAGVENLKLNGYNVYRDGLRLNETTITETEWTDAGADKEACNIYKVTAVYDRGESPEAEVMVAPASVADVVAGVEVYARNGEIVISGANGEYFTVANVAGVIVASGSAEPVTAVKVAPGVYVATVAGKSYKLVVK